MEENLPLIKLSPTEIRFLTQYRYFHRTDGECIIYSYNFGNEYGVIEPIIKSLIKKKLLVDDSGIDGLGLTKLGREYAWMLYHYKTL